MSEMESRGKWSLAEDPNEHNGIRDPPRKVMGITGSARETENLRTADVYPVKFNAIIMA